MNVEVRPATKAEQMYCYTQSDQIMGQTGCIGHLRADMGDSGEQFFHNWTSHCERLLTPEFDAEFNQVIRQLREEDGFLKSRAAVSAYCYRQIDSAIDLSSQDFAFRADTKDYSYLLRLNPQKGMYTVYCYCYQREFLDHHLKQAEKGIRFITSNYTELFRIPDGGKIRILREDGTHIDKVCRYIDDYHVEVGSGWDSLFHICQFAEQMERCHNTHVFIDEFHVMFENEFSAAFFNSAWRQFRKRNAYPTAITQNVEYLLDSVQASTMLSNSEFIVMLNQAASDREKLAHLLNISNEQMSYITNADAGCGLIKYGSALVPFINRFPQNTKLYELMTTRPGEGQFAHGQE